ncbi:MAG: transglycosylase domain-containing protein [Thermoleophilaceae bacterium]
MQSPPKTPTSHVPRADASGPNGGPPAAKPKVKKLRLALILAGLSVLAMVSTVFGMMMAVASDLPQLENKAEFRAAKNSVVETMDTDGDGKGDELAKLTGNNNRILIGAKDISPNIRNAVIAIEDRRFYEHEGVDYKGIARALYQDVRQRSAAQGGSTITQQFVKNALAAQGNRSVFQKLRESALAYHLERQWTKEKVLTQYLNSIYFGNGAYGVEAAKRTYFGDDDPDGTAAATPTPDVEVEDTDADDDLDTRAAREASPAEAALLAGMIASPSLYDPIQNPKNAQSRRDLVLLRMREQDFITETEYQQALDEDLPQDNDVDPPQPDSEQPYFTSWLTQQLVDRYSAPAVFSGGLNVKTTLDPELQLAAEQAIEGRLGGVGPSASLVAIENDTGEVKAMVGGTDFESRPFNLATNGHRQPGSAFKPFTLIRALEDGVSPDATYTSQPKSLGPKGRKFAVANYEDSYSGVLSLRSATASSDNSVFAEVGLDAGTKRIAALANNMGVRTELSTNPAMTLGGLKEGVTPLELAYAYSTIANKGMKVSGTLASSRGGPVAIDEVTGGGRNIENKPVKERVFSESVGETAHELLAGVVLGGTGKSAQIGEFAAGKTGTTENYGDAWFAGFNEELTVAVWVGYPDSIQPMESEYAGGPVAGGTYPTEIWHDLMVSWIEIRERRELEKDAADGDDEDESTDEVAPLVPAEPVEPEVVPTVPVEPEPVEPVEPQDAPAPVDEAPAPAPTQPPVPQQPAPAPAPVPTPAPAPGPGGAGGGAAPE